MWALGTLLLSLAFLLILPSAAVAQPTSSAACSPKEAFRRSTAALMWPEASRSFLITPDGGLDNGEWVTRIEMVTDGGRPLHAEAITARCDGLPILGWQGRERDVTWDVEAVALGSPWDSGAVASVRVRAENKGAQPRVAVVRVSFEKPPRANGFVAPDAPEAARLRYAWSGDTSARRVAGWSDGRRSHGAVTGTWHLEASESESIRVVVPTYLTRPTVLRRWAAVPHAERVTQALRYWSTVVDSGLQLALRDPEVETAYRAGLVVLLGCVERHAGRLVPIGNPFQYRDVWLRDGARCITALAMAGHTEVARELARGFLVYQWPQGPFLSQRGQLDGTGHALWAFEQAFLRPSASPDVKTIAKAAQAAWRWSEGQRASTQILGLPFGNLLPLAEPRDNELPKGKAQLVGNDAWTIAGYRATARLLHASGSAGAAKEVLRSRTSYIKTFRDALVRTKAADIPPTWQAIGRDWGNLAVSYPCDVLPASDPRCHAIARRAWGGSPIPGLVRCGNEDSVHTYLSADLASWAMLAGLRYEADRTLRALLAWRTASGGSPEIFTATARDYALNYPPHATAAAAIVAVIRNSLVYDDEDTLRLTYGARAGWWEGASVRGAPTRWGAIDLTFESSGDTAIWRWSPVPVPTALRLPPRFEVADIDCLPEIRVLEPDLILLPAHAQVVVLPIRSRQALPNME